MILHGTNRRRASEFFSSTSIVKANAMHTTCQSLSVLPVYILYVACGARWGLNAQWKQDVCLNPEQGRWMEERNAASSQAGGPWDDGDREPEHTLAQSCTVHLFNNKTDIYISIIINTFFKRIWNHVLWLLNSRWTSLGNQCLLRNGHLHTTNWMQICLEIKGQNRGHFYGNTRVRKQNVLKIEEEQNSTTLHKHLAFRVAKKYTHTHTKCSGTFFRVQSVSFEMFFSGISFFPPKCHQSSDYLLRVGRGPTGMFGGIDTERVTCCGNYSVWWVFQPFSAKFRL